jgi:hypothetical protein
VLVPQKLHVSAAVAVNVGRLCRRRSRWPSAKGAYQAKSAMPGGGGGGGLFKKNMPEKNLAVSML